MGLHGYRPGGSRIVAFDVDAKGVPVPAQRPRFAEYTPDGKVVLKAYESRAPLPSRESSRPVGI